MTEHKTHIQGHGLMRLSIVCICISCILVFLSSFTKMHASAFVAVMFVVCARAQEVEISDNQTECLSRMVSWCANMTYPQQGMGMSMLSITYEDPSGYCRVFCSSDADGTNCTRNRQPWFACSQNNTLTYKGREAFVDADVCETADKAFNELFVQNLFYSNTTLKTEFEKGMESFFAQMAAMQEQIDEIRKRMRDIPLFGGNFWDRFLFGGFDSANATEQTNLIEMEWK